MSEYRFFGNYNLKNIILALMHSDTFGIALNINEVYTYGNMLPTIPREINIGYIYLIQSLHHGIPCLKIGKTLDLRRRMLEYAACNELQNIVGAYIVGNMNLGELFLIRTFDQKFTAPHDVNNKRIGREYYIWTESVQRMMLCDIYHMISFTST